MPRTTRNKLDLFRACFTGLTHVYGTYDPKTGQVRQVKAPVTDRVILQHLQGLQPYGVYLLVGDRTRALAADFDDHDLNPPMELLAAARNYGLAAYIEASKSKGYHVWMFFEEGGVLAAKARRVAKQLLQEIGMQDSEVFPKQDRIDVRTAYGNFINAPLFGALVPRGRTVFLDEKNPARPVPDPWSLLEGVQRIPESALDDILGDIGLPQRDPGSSCTAGTTGPLLQPASFGLPPCAQRMLAEGVGEHQRTACFRLALQLKKAGIPQDITLAGLRAWAVKNRPRDGRRVISPSEIAEQTAWAYAKPYRGCGCDDPGVKPYCMPECPLRLRHPDPPPTASVARCPSRVAPG